MAMSGDQKDFRTIQVTTPRNVEAERTVLCGATMNPDYIPRLAQRIRSPETFWQQTHRSIWRAMVACVENKRDVNETTVLDELEGFGYEMTNELRSTVEDVFGRVVLAEQRDEAVEVIRRKAVLRNAMWGLVSAADDVSNNRVTPEELSKKVSDISKALALEDDGVDPSHPKQVAKAMIDRWEKLLNGHDEVGYRCGIDPVDRLMEPGWENGMNNVICAYSGIGKTTLGSAICGGLADTHDAVISYWPCEIGRVYQATRILTSVFARDDMSTIREQRALYPNKVSTDKSKRFKNEMLEAMHWFKESKIYLESPGMIDVRDVEMKARSLRSEYPDRPLVVCVDYLQYCHTGDLRMSKSDRISAASMRLKNLAVELDLIMITLTQLTGKPQDGIFPIPVPSKSQVRHSKDIENDADNILIYHRPWDTKEGMSHHGLLVREKARFLTPKHVRLKADGGRNTFEWSESPDIMDEVQGAARTPCINSKRYT